MKEEVIEISYTLKHLLHQHKVTEAELGRKINVPRATINRLVAGRTPDPRASTLKAIAEYFNVTVDQLLGKQPLVRENTRHYFYPNSSIPIIDWFQAKEWQKYVNHLKPVHHSDWVMVDSHSNQGKFALRVIGESMWPQFQVGTILIVDPNKDTRNRDFCIVYIDRNDEVIFRQFITEGKYSFLKPINDIFPTLEVRKEDKMIGTIIQTRNSYN